MACVLRGNESQCSVLAKVRRQATATPVPCLEVAGGHAAVGRIRAVDKHGGQVTIALQALMYQSDTRLYQWRVCATDGWLR